MQREDGRRRAVMRKGNSSAIGEMKCQWAVFVMHYKVTNYSVTKKPNKLQFKFQ